MLTERHRHRCIPATPLSIALGLALAVAGNAGAQEAAPVAKATELQRIEVTASTPPTRARARLVRHVYENDPNALRNPPPYIYMTRYVI